MRPRLPVPLLLSLLCLASTGCTFALGRSAAQRAGSVAPAEATTGAAVTKAAAKPDHERQCSQLRADIASSQHNQRASTPASNSPIIAAASTAKEDQRIEALQKRYAELGCVGTPTPEPTRKP